LSSRTLSMITRYFDGEVPYPSPSETVPADEAIAELAMKTIAGFHAQFEQFQFSRALETAWSLVAAVNKYIVENEPWAVAEREDKDSRARLATILYTSAEALRVVTALVHPIIPEATARIWTQLGLGEIDQLDLRTLAWGNLPLGTKLGKVEGVFPRADKSTVERMQQMEQQRSADLGQASEKTVAAEAQPAASGAQPEQPATQAAAGPSAAAPAESGAIVSDKTTTATGGGSVTAAAAASPNQITIDDFLKVELRVGEVKVAERVKGTDKLLRLEVDIGSEVRQVVAGIAKAYEPERLIGRKVVIVANLQPRKLRGLESNGMIVAASIGDDGQPVLAGFLEDVPVGAKLK
jgi:methionyl-tRNA synthetase